MMSTHSIRLHNPHRRIVDRGLSVCLMAYAVWEVVVMYIPQDEVEYVRFMLIVDGLMAGVSAGVLVSYIVLCIIEWIRRLKNGR